MSTRSTELIGIGRFKIREGQAETYKQVARECREIARTKDKGTLQYEIYFNDDDTEVMFVERYKDSESLIEHFQNLGNRVEEILKTVTVIHGELLGEPSPELRKLLETGEYPHLFANQLL